MLKNFSTFIFVLFSGSAVFCQSSVNTDQVNQVYSKYGVGITRYESNIRNISMGGTGISAPGSFSINYFNPALLTYNDATSFEFNVVGDFRSAVDENGTEYADNETGINSIRFSLPVFRSKWQTSLGISPFSRVNYKVYSSAPIGSIQDSMHSYTRIAAQGAINRVSWKNGFRVARNLHLGVDVSYYFGSIFHKNLSYVRNDNGNNILMQDYQRDTLSIATGSRLTQDIRYVNYRGISSTLGVSYLRQFDSLPFDLFIGAVYDLNAMMRSDLLNYIEKPGLLDTTVSKGNTEPMPSKFGAGVSLVFKDSSDYQRYILSIDYVGRKYNNVQNNRLGIGFEKLPNPHKINSFSKNMFRLGGYYSQNELLFRNQGVDEFGITFGIGIPKKKTSDDTGWERSVFDVGVVVGQHGTFDNGGIKESFVRLNVGFTFNDRWFQKIRIN